MSGHDIKRAHLVSLSGLLYSTSLTVEVGKKEGIGRRPVREVLFLISLVSSPYLVTWPNFALA